MDRATARCARRCSCACATTSIRKPCSAPKPTVGRDAARAAEDEIGARGRRDRRHRRAARNEERIGDARGRRRPDPLTHLDRVYWPADPALQQPALTKRDLLRYFAQVSPYILPHLADRPLTMIRMPDGIDGQRFFQKHWSRRSRSSSRSITVCPRAKDESHDYLAVQQPADAALARAVGHARVPRLAFAREGRTRMRSRRAPTTRRRAESLDDSVLNYPDCVVFDIDPYIYSGKETKGEEPELNTVAFEKGKEVAFWLRELLQTHEARADREDVGQDRPARVRADQAHDRLRRGAARLGTGRPAPDAPAPEGHHDGVERAEANRQDLHGLQHERARKNAERRLFAARRAGRAGLDAADLGGARQGAIRSISASRT